MDNKKMRRYMLHDRLDLSVSNRAVDKSFALHWHNYIELELITAGSGYQILNGQHIELSRGCLSLLRPTDFHQVEPGENLHLLNMAIDDTLLSEDMLRQITAPQILFFRMDEQELMPLEQLLLLSSQESTSAVPDQQYLKHLLMCILLRILRLMPDSSNPVSTVERPIQASLLYLHVHFRENPRLSDVAKIAHYNTSYFSSVFHRETGMTYSEYLNMLKITYAKELLLSTELKISDVYYKCGFSSHSNFLRLFREQTGLTPMQFRKSAILCQEQCSITQCQME